MVGFELPAPGLDQGGHGMDRLGGQARGLYGARRVLWRQVTGVAGGEVGQVGTADRRLRQDVRRRVCPGEPREGLQLPAKVYRQVADHPGLLGVR